MIDTDRMWDRWGRTDPYFGVLADPRFTKDRIDAHRATFFESGRAQVAAMLATFEQHFGPLARDSALDHGCGVGRLTMPLAAEFDQVVGVDVSPAMLAEAEANCAANTISNVEFARSDDELSGVERTFDFVNSAMVLQHVPVRRGKRLIAALIERVAPGGGFHLHLSTRTDRRRSRVLWWTSANVPGVKTIQNLLAGRAWDAPAMQMNNYALSDVVDMLSTKGVSQILLKSELHGRFLTVSLFGRVA
ncbi:class I SAM-dependent methyltransferase [Sphingomonas glaciei]|uniref:Class I SAM-dependent methyltransferase n=1 Tax=Sphingomonas glaciei TaxID=2938948 RepID=A0ABY5MX95_9SPHN|nr:class I SAM-dependent methyltransferase [Sphingomonas glaciei]UUR08104.1 class I SAM-dependent methyltransferase [Sphingomonas glaciei]